MSYDGPSPLPVKRGGTGAATLTGVLTGNGTSAVTANAVTQHGVLIAGASNAVASLGVASTGTVLQGSTGADPAFTATPTVTSISFGGTALSNYTEGTWTPTMVGQTSAGTTTYTVQNGYYTRIGNMVTIWGIVQGSAATGTGNALFGGFPFTIKNQSNYTVAGAVFCSNNAAWTFPAGTTMITCEGLGNTTTANMFASGSGSGGGALQIQNAAFAFWFELRYQI